MRKSSVMSSLLAMALMSEDMYPMSEEQYNESKPVEFRPTHHEPKPKKGQKTYFFNKFGHFDNGEMLKSECVFQCFAINAKNAIKKFKKWKKDEC